MSHKNTDKEWELLGKTNPYYGVLSRNKYLRKNLTSTSRDEFFESGKKDIDMIVRLAEKNFDDKLDIKRVLDFGCGVGRMSIPFAKYAKTVVGADVSPSMLREARKNAKKYNIKNIDFVQSNDSLSAVVGTFDFIYSMITFQHIPVKRGEKIFEQLIDKLNKGGIGSMHFTYRRDIGWFRSTVTIVKKYLPFCKQLINLLQGRNLHCPIVQMNCYDINKLLQITQDKNISRVSLQFTKHKEYYGAIIFLQKEE